MKKLFLLLTFSLFTLYFVNAQENVEEIYWSENIRDTFFGVKFGETEEDVVEAFTKEGFLFEKVSYNFNLRSCIGFWFENRYHSFGGFDWSITHVYFANNKFYEINFIRFFETKESALKYVGSIMSVIESKYYMYELPIRDNEYKSHGGYSEDGKFVGISCISVNKDGQTFYATILRYSDENFDPTNEL